MKYGWPERISGAVILIALAVIFVPLLFSEPAPRSERPQPVLTIEQPIEVPRTEVPEPRPPSSLGEFGGPMAMPEEDEALRDDALVEEVAEIAEEAAEQLARAEAPAEVMAPPVVDATPSPRAEPAPSPAPDPIAELARAADQRLAESRSQSAGTPAPAASGGEWAVQVGSFGEPANAERLLQQLREQGFPAYSQPRDNNLTTVYAGPYRTSEEGERAMNELKSRTNHQGLLVRARN
ncbi:SPOR domain-containing protein [Halomonas sp. A11-A]|uniref:SPOR domain-containing protein n=1 Tax=Halomonas sp. A11-A TaxID=2183985 RepID=UPI000D70F3AE|nr:SPOR domain-containing protein [Halomonas sp. A11-A]PWV67826.1 DedD protein [Halomonas sp. A11-A]